MEGKLGILVLSILVCKIQAQAVEVSTNLQYSQVSFPSYPPAFIQTPQPVVQQVIQSPVEVVSPPVPVAFPPQQYIPALPPIPLPYPIPQPPPPVAVSLPTQQQLPPPPVTITTPAPVPIPQPIFQLPQYIPSPTVIPAPTIQVSPPPISPAVEIVQELPVSVNIPAIPTVVSPPVVVSPPQIISPPVLYSSPQIPLISTTRVDNSLANKLANVLQLFMVSQALGGKVNPYCNTPYYSDVTPLYDTLGSIGTAYSPLYTPGYGVADIVPSIFGTITEPLGAVTELYPLANIGAASEVISPFGDYYTYSSMPELLLPGSPLAYNVPQLIETLPPLEQLVYF